jgi:hypothetical protein
MRREKEVTGDSKWGVRGTTTRCLPRFSTRATVAGVRAKSHDNGTCPLGTADSGISKRANFFRADASQGLTAYQRRPKHPCTNVLHSGQRLARDDR